jgi:MoxR-like ATPase
MTGPLKADLVLDDLAALQEIRQRILAQVERVVVGQNQVIEQLLITLFVGGHCLLVGPSGLAKTLLVRALADSLDLSFKRIQFTPDLMPSDITGTEVIEENRATGSREFKFLRGPLFANLVLADEINRSTPRTQAALLEAMEERKVTYGGTDHPLDLPFHVLATQNPLAEHEGTYPLPEAQLDRFLFQIDVDYPSLEDEIQIMKTAATRDEVVLTPVIHRLELLRVQKLVRQVPVANEVYRYTAELVRASRPEERGCDKATRDWVSWGAGPRASLGLIVSAQARAALFGRLAVTIDDIRAVAQPGLRHRIVLNFTAASEGIKPDQVIARLLQRVS